MIKSKLNGCALYCHVLALNYTTTTRKDGYI